MLIHTRCHIVWVCPAEALYPTSTSKYVDSSRRVDEVPPAGWRWDIFMRSCTNRYHVIHLVNMPLELWHKTHVGGIMGFRDNSQTVMPQRLELIKEYHNHLSTSLLSTARRWKFHYRPKNRSTPRCNTPLPPHSSPFLPFFFSFKVCQSCLLSALNTPVLIGSS